MAGRVLHVLAQRPERTGSGVTLQALARGAAAARWQQHAAVGVHAGAPFPRVAGLRAEQVHALAFGRGALPFALPGMSDVMPYPSSRFSELGSDELEAYRTAWREHLVRVIETARPDVIHAHHCWIVTALLAEVAPSVPVVVHVHATGLRQMELCPHLADEVRAGCRQHAAFCALHAGHVGALERALGVPAERVHVVGAGYDRKRFHAAGRDPQPGRVLYAGKLSAAKGLPELAAAFARLWRADATLELEVAGAGSGAEGRAIAARLERTPGVRLLGQLDPDALAERMRRASVFALPSFYEGMPLVLVEAAASGCRLVATALPGVVSALAPRLGEHLELVAPPPMRAADEPEPAALPAFVRRLTAALAKSLERPPPPPADLAPFAWPAVFERVEAVWRRVVT